MALVLSAGCMAFAFAQAENKTSDPQAQVIGTIFNAPVPVNNYYFIRSAIMVFGNRWGTQPQTPEQLDDVTWEQLVLSFEAYRRNISVSPVELALEIDRVMQSEKVNFDRTKDLKAYEKWVKEKTNEPVELFENQLRHLVQIQKLRDQVQSTIKPIVTEEATRQAFLDEQNHLDLEVAKFEYQQQAQQFFEAVKRKPDLWEETKKNKPEIFKRPGMVTIIFLMDLWKFPRNALYAMLTMDDGQLHQPEPIFEGFGVFKVLGKRPADESGFAKSKNVYFDRVAIRQRNDSMRDWLTKLKQDASIKIYKQGG
ncbi:MAG: hypothetical protein KBA46_05200 [Candidatus Omnitrophica bacterium]|nr:hypothetical protein [Candidatus Omnitrophota bacterium]